MLCNSRLTGSDSQSVGSKLQNIILKEETDREWPRTFCKVRFYNINEQRKQSKSGLEMFHALNFCSTEQHKELKECHSALAFLTLIKSRSNDSRDDLE